MFNITAVWKIHRFPPLRCWLSCNATTSGKVGYPADQTCLILRIFQHTPEPQPTAYEAILFIWGFVDAWGMFPGSVGIFLD